MKALVDHLRDFSHLAFPFNCCGCSRALDHGEQVICDDCQNGFPLTKYWEFVDNGVAKLFWGKMRIERACAFTFFTKGGMVQQLIHALKYDGRTEVGEIMGGCFGEYLKSTDYKDVDIVIPVPLHVSKEKKRGYNQCEYIARGIAEKLQKPYTSQAVVRLRANDTQTRKGVYERWINVRELFDVDQPELVQGKHVLLVDDVVTTGSTLEACAGALLKVPGTRLSAVTLACPSPI